MVTLNVAPYVVAGGLLLAAAACKGSGEPPTTLAAQDTADQVLYGFEHNVTVDGVFRARLTADTAFLYQGTQTALLYGLQVRFYSPEGELTSTVTANDGTYDWRTGDMEARGDVVAETPDDRVLTTTILRYVRREDTIAGPEAFVFDAPDQHLEGDGFTADPNFTNVETQNPRSGRVGELDVRR
ncbi:MAG: LPS export ABC transporter periplasmic protein LptC [Gemmatimonadota bacterium]|nr:MAG: LPS export ABC transporter periplasmic protein LptC [Gemmatimonadota bacterium]